MPETYMGKITLLGTLAGIVLLLSIAVYAFNNDSGHSSANPYLALALFVPLVIDGLLCLVFSLGTQEPRWVSMCAIATGIAGVVFLVWLDKSNTLLQYEVWLVRNMW